MKKITVEKTRKFHLLHNSCEHTERNRTLNGFLLNKKEKRKKERKTKMMHDEGHFFLLFVNIKLCSFFCHAKWVEWALEAQEKGKKHTNSIIKLFDLHHKCDRLSLVCMSSST